jgi:hypothetical protein
LESTIYGSFDPSYTARESAFEAAREAAASRVGDAVVEVDGAALLFQARGHRWGAGFFSWVCEYDGIRYSLAKSSQSNKCPVAKIQISSLKLTRDGVIVAWQQALRTLKHLGVIVYSNTLYRLDACLDLPGVDVGLFCEAISHGEVISRVKSQASFNKSAKGEWQGCAIGNRKGVRIVFYDKIEELKAHPGIESEAKREVLIQQRWGVAPERATRVEFQIRGEWLRQRYQGLRSVEDVLGRLADVVAFLATGFFRIVDGEVDRDNNNQSRAEVSPMWNRVIEGFCDWAGGDAAQLIKVEKKPANREKAIKRLLSSAVSVAAFSPGYVCSRETFLQRVIDELVHALPSEEELIKKLWVKQDVLDAKGVFGVFTFDDLQPGKWATTAFQGWNAEEKRWEPATAVVRADVGFDGDE